jgi:hypothetical protein
MKKNNSCWISHDNRQVLVDFVRRKLKVGGVMYISYNTLPGWAAFAPMRHLMTKARSSNDISFLASPVTGGGISVGRFEQLFLLALGQGKKQPAEWAQFVWGILQAQGQKLVKEGRTLETEEENLAELNEQARKFGEKQVPVLRALGVV